MKLTLIKELMESAGSSYDITVSGFAAPRGQPNFFTLHKDAKNEFSNPYVSKLEDAAKAHLSADISVTKVVFEVAQFINDVEKKVDGLKRRQAKRGRSAPSITYDPNRKAEPEVKVDRVEFNSFEDAIAESEGLQMEYSIAFTLSGEIDEADIPNTAESMCELIWGEIDEDDLDDLDITFKKNSFLAKSSSLANSILNKRLS